MSAARAGLVFAVFIASGAGPAYAQAPGATRSRKSDVAGDDDHDDDGDEYVEPDHDNANGPVTTGALRVAAYEDTDKTSVIRTLAQVASNTESWVLTGTATVDVVTSASIDVRSSPELSKVDVVTSASGRSSTSGGQMTDQRLQGTGSAGWNDGAGHALSLAATAAAEQDYRSLSADISGSYDIVGRAGTLLGGVSFTDNWIHSVLDPTLSETMYSVGWSAGLAWVLTPDDAVRFRYDGTDSEGYQASPYRSVRFGDWTTTTSANGQLQFHDTIGAAEGMPEVLPDSRISHAITGELVHALGDGVGLHPSLRLGHDSWGMQSATAAIDLRVARPGWRLQLGYRAYLQSGADFFRGKYTEAPEMYTYYTSDKELGRETGHVGTFGISAVLRDPKYPGDSRLLFDARVNVMYYDYPGFDLLGSRAGAFFEAGLSWEL